MADDFYTQHIRKTLSPMENKVVEIYNMGYGWESWAQVELALEMRATITKPGYADITTPKFMREKTVYTNQRCDFATEYCTLDGKKICYFAELKCLSRGYTTNGFAELVADDYRKVKEAKLKDNYTRGVDYLGGWVVAITVDPERTGGIDNVMRKLAKDEGFEWLNNWEYSPSNPVIKAWTWTKTLVRDGKPSPAQ